MIRNKFTAVKDAKKRKKSSTAWLKRQINDPFVKQAHELGFRSRSAFKIIEIDDKFKIFKKGKIVLDLGSAPGGWSQVASQKAGKNKVFAIDILDMPKIEGVKFLQQDFLAPDAIKNITNLLQLEPPTFSTETHQTKSNEILNNSNNELILNKNQIIKKCDIILSDMAINTCGDAKTDHLRIVGLLEEVLDFSCKILAKDGVFIGKIFQGGASKDLLKRLRENFTTVKHFKPKSSRKQSTENYIIALKFNNLPTPKI